MIWSPTAFLVLGDMMLSAKTVETHGDDSSAGRRFRSSFGVSHEVCSHVWEYMDVHNTKPRKALPMHLLWCLMYFKTYETEVFLATVVGSSERCFRKWIWIMAKSISQLYQHVVSKVIMFLYAFNYYITNCYILFKILFEKRMEHDSGNRWCRLTVDGTDFRICKPSPFSTRWFSHKFKGPGLRYEVAVSIVGGDIVHTNGPFPCGAWPDIKIFRSDLINKLAPGEMVEADNGYRGQPDKIRTPVNYDTIREKK